MQDKMLDSNFIVSSLGKPEKPLNARPPLENVFRRL